MVPRAVLMKSGLVSINTARQNISKIAVLVNTARQVNAAHSKTTVNAARPMSYLSKTTHSTVKRPIHKNTSFKNRNMSYLTNYEEIDGGYVAFGGNPKEGKITGKVNAGDSNVKAKTINEEVQLHALVDDKKIIITESTVRRDLQLEDAEGIDCLPNSTIFEQLTLIGSKTTALNEFSSTMASAIICLATKNEAVYKELGDSLVRAATTASNLEAEQDSGNITKTRSKATPNESSFLGTTSGGSPRYQETIGDTIAQTRFENVSKHSNDSTISSTVNVAGTNKVNVVGSKTSIELPFDQNMPALEDVSIFDFSRDYEDDVVVANINNLGTRIHKDHPLDQIKEEGYVSQPLGFEDPDFPDRVYKVEKALYGLHQAPKAWYETLSTYVLDNEFQRGKIDKTIFIKRYKGDILLVQVYVDDIIFGSTKKELCVAFEKLMHEKFHMSSMDTNYRINSYWDLQKFRFTEAKTASAPMETQKPLLKDENGEEVDVLCIGQ
ncbi:uncharacterized mitochondrial protein-like protein [Tanacetum coccineum]